MDLPHLVIPIDNKWVYKIRRKQDGSVGRYKARLVAKGYNQWEGLDYYDTFSLVTKITNMIVLMDLASINIWFIYAIIRHKRCILTWRDLHEDLQRTFLLDSLRADRIIFKNKWGLKQDWIYGAFFIRIWGLFYL